MTRRQRFNRILLPFIGGDALMFSSSRPKAWLTVLCLLLPGFHSLAAEGTPTERGQQARGGAESGRRAMKAGLDDVTGSCAERAADVDRMLRKAAGGPAFGPSADLPNQAYGSHPKQRLDVFLPKNATRGAPAPVLVMVHGGGWCVGDKALAAVTRNKVNHWVGKGFVFVSVGYRMLPDGLQAFQQAADVAKALAHVQQHAPEWGGDPQRVILMGHSAGAHLVSLVNADASLRESAGARQVLGTISLDSGATNVVTQMRRNMPATRSRYEEAFGTEESGWIKASPYHRIDTTASPWLGVCSTKRPDDPCAQAREYAGKSLALGIRAVVLPIDLAHGPVNRELGLPGSYTAEVDAFMASLDPTLKQRLR
jgi:arylformamidase